MDKMENQLEYAARIGLPSYEEAFTSSEAFDASRFNDFPGSGIRSKVEYALIVI